MEKDILNCRDTKMRTTISKKIHIKTVEGNCLFSGQWSMVNQLTIRGVYGQLIDHKRRLWPIN